MTFASFLAAIEGAVIAAYVALKPTGVTRYSLLAMMIGFGASTLLALWAAQPVAFDIPGGRPADWQDDIKQGDSLHNGRAAMAGYLDEMIVDNDATLRNNANFLTAALVGVVLTLIIAGVLAAFI